MGYFYKTYLNSWESGEPFLLHIPTYTRGSDGVHQVSGINVATRDYGYCFDHTYTLFAINAIQTNLAKTAGFIQVIDVTNPIDIYVSADKYIHVYSRSNRVNFQFYINESVVLTYSPSYPVTTVLGFNISLDVPNMEIRNFIEASFQFGCYLNSTLIGKQSVLDFWSDVTPFTPSTDPFNPGGESGTGGGTGDFDGTSDAIPIPDLPTLSATSTGFITLFNPDASQLRALANYMWSNSLFDLDTWKKIFADPMDAILGLSIVPVAVPSGGAVPVSVGNISTDVSMTIATAQYVEIDCGTLNVNEYWGAYLDYDPFTKAEIYLPYIGTHALAVDDIMGKAVHVVYHVDILSGACAAYVQCGESVLYTFIGQCASSIPITGNDWTNVINGVITAAASIGSMVATGGESAPFAVPALASTAVNSLKPTVEKSGSLAGTGGMLGIQSPYIILTRPRQALPANQNVFMGYPSFITENLGSISGYTEIESVHLENIPATEQELSEIETLLKGGVIL